MTMKPKAKKFRIRRNAGDPATTGAGPEGTGAQAQGTARPVSQPKQAAAQPARSQPAAARQPREPAPAGAKSAVREGQVSSARETTVEGDIDAIRSEGLTGRQLRMARRVAQKHNLPATSDFDAVRLLRKKGFDPFQRSNMLELVVSPDGKSKEAVETGDPGKVQLPQTIPVGKETLPSTDLSPAQRREQEISEIQHDLVKRRRRKLGLLLTRLAFFVLLPTFIAGYYFYAVATPMYSTKSAFLIIKNESGGSGVGGLFSGTQFATSQDSIATQTYLHSKDGMLRLDREEGFREHFSQPWIDPIQRLDADASNEDTYKLYKKYVEIGYDPTEGVIHLDVAAADPEVAAEFSRRLISYAEQRVNQLSKQKRSDQMREATKSFDSAVTERRNAQLALVNLQQQGAILDPQGVIAGLRGRINQVEIQLQEKELQLAALLDNARPNRAKVEGARGDISRLENLLADLNAQMVDASKGENSLAQLAVRIQMAQADLATRDLMLQSALQEVESTRQEANKQVRYLTTSVQPVASQEPSYPRKFENTILAFLIFSGIYLMISLTASILREQISH
ncbi:MAG: capsule biosynthesis protein [Paracoccaceae bacterium]